MIMENILEWQAAFNWIYESVTEGITHYSFTAILYVMAITIQYKRNLSSEKHDSRDSKGCQRWHVLHLM